MYTCSVACQYIADVPGSGLYFGGYEFLLNSLTPEGQRLDNSHNIENISLVCVLVGRI